MEVLPAALMAIVNYLVFSLALMLLARYVVDQKLFGVYSAAVAAITVAATAATLGMEKYLLKIVPKYRAEHRMPLVRGFRRFAPLVVVVVTVLVMGVLLLVHRLSPRPPRSPPRPSSSRSGSSPRWCWSAGWWRW